MISHTSENDQGLTHESHWPQPAVNMRGAKSGASMSLKMQQRENHTFFFKLVSFNQHKVENTHPLS